MSGTFAASALQLAGLVPRLLGWRPDEFWNATPAELAAILIVPAGIDGDPLSRRDLAVMMERDANGRQD
ncbi:MAG: hypothetical protein RLZZ08_59 [Pseudomonadota bacterium]|jgi:hypothetical protein